MRKREGNINVWLSPTEELARNPGVRPDQGSKQRLPGLQDSTQPLSRTSQGRFLFFEKPPITPGEERRGHTRTSGRS